MSDYKKRALAGWCGGKHGKKWSNRTERQFARAEVSQFIREEEEGFRYTGGKRKRTKREKKIKNLKSRISSFKRLVEKGNDEDYTTWFSYNVNHYKSQIEKLTEKLNKLQKAV